MTSPVTYSLDTDITTRLKYLRLDESNQFAIDDVWNARSESYRYIQAILSAFTLPTDSTGLTGLTLILGDVEADLAASKVAERISIMNGQEPPP
jgi:hypothetical protein